MNPNMILPKLFLPLFTNIFFFFFFLFLVETALSADPQFEACVPRNCSSGPKIRYPFWIQGHESYCGYPGYDVSCVKNRPVLNKFGKEFYVREIHHESNSLLIANTEAFNSTCPIPLHNISQNLSPFYLSARNFHLNFLLNCNESYPLSDFFHNFSCLSNTTHHSYIYWGPPTEEKIFSKNCESHITRPVAEDPEKPTVANFNKGNYIALLELGFLLEWPPVDYCGACEFSGGHCGYNNKSESKFLCFCPDRPYPLTCPPKGTKKDDKKAKIAIGVVAGSGSLIIAGIVFIIFLCRKRIASYSSTLRSRTLSFCSSSKLDIEDNCSCFPTHIFSYEELEEATNNFDSSKELGSGGFGTVYHGKLRDGRSVAVKRLFESNCRRVEQFINEVKILSQLRHQHLVSLYGCTSRHSRELLLVYEFIPNGTVADHIHGQRANTNILPWPVRLSIAIETADAIAYLHAVDPQIIHRDVKTNNILLDNNFRVKVADFGLSRLFPNDVSHVSTAPQGTPGYVDPDYHQCYQLTDRSDVYSFGVVLIELISSKPAVDLKRHRQEISLARMAIHKIHNHALHELVDPCLGFESDGGVRKMITLVAELAFRCLQMDKERRPSMEEVLEALRRIEREGYEVEKTNDADTLFDDIRLSKISSSPVSVADKWVSRSTTPNSSG